MSSLSNPILFWRVAAAVCSSLGVGSVAVAGWWVLQPRAVFQPPTLPQRAAEATAAETPTSFDRAAFAARVWHAPPAPPPSPTVRASVAVAPPPRLSLELLAISRVVDGDETVLEAVVFDPNDNTIQRLRPGGVVSGAVCAEVKSGSVSFEYDARTHTLRLDPESGS